MRKIIAKLFALVGAVLLRRPRADATVTNRTPQQHRQLPATFSVGVVDASGRRRSLVWRFALKSKDIYVAPGLHFGAPAPSIAHISLHADGRCHHGFDSKFYKERGKTVTGTDDRFMHRWTREPTPTDRIAPAFSIVILPDAPGVEPPPDEGHRFDIELPAPGPGRAREIMIAYSYVTPPKLTSVDMEVLGFHQLKTGEFVYLISVDVPYDPRQLKVPNTGASYWLGGADRDLPPHMRIVLFGDLTPNHSFGFDAAVQASNSQPGQIDILIGTALEPGNGA